VANSTPIVLLLSKLNSFRVKRDNRLLFPTPESPINTTVHTHTHPFNGPLSVIIRVSWYQKGKTNLDFTEARDSEWHGISWVICKSAPHSKQISTTAPHNKVHQSEQCHMISLFGRGVICRSNSGIPNTNCICKVME